MVYDKWQHVLYSKQHIQTRLATDFLLPLSLGWLELRPHQCGLVHTVVISFTVLLIIIIIIIISSLHPDYFLYRALEAACAAYASLNLSLLHYITLHYTSSAQWNGTCMSTVQQSQEWPVLAKLVSASPAWSGFCLASNVNKLDRFVNRCKAKQSDHSTEQFDKANQSLFQTVLFDNHQRSQFRLANNTPRI